MLLDMGPTGVGKSKLANDKYPEAYRKAKLWMVNYW